MRNTLPKSSILRGYKIFSNVIQNGISFRTKIMDCYVRVNDKIFLEENGNWVQVGFVIPKKQIPLAVDRNRIKRLLREVYRHNKTELNTIAKIKNVSLKVVIIFRLNKQKEVRQLRYSDIENYWKEIEKKIIFFFT